MPKIKEPVVVSVPNYTTKKLYFDNNTVEDLLTRYKTTGCTDVALRDKIMDHAGELIRQIIRTHNLHRIYRGHEESAFGDLFQTGWCVPLDTLILTEHGMCQIGDLAGEEPIGDCNTSVMTHDGIAKATKYVKLQEVETRAIETQYGYSIEASLDHPLPVLTADGIIRKKVAEIREGDLLSVRYNQQCFGSDDAIRHQPVARWGTTVLWNPPDKFTDELAYIIGLIISDGSVSGHRVTIYNNNSDIINNVLDNQCGLKFTYVECNGGRLVCNCVRFIEFLGWLGIEAGVRSYDKSIPLRMLRCSRNIVASLIRGVADGDGHSSKSNGEVGFTSSSKKLIDQLRVILANFGMITKTYTTSPRNTKFNNHNRIYESITRTSYQLRLSSIDSYKYYNMIGFGVGYKQDKRSNLTKRPWRSLSDSVCGTINSELSLEFSRYQIAKHLGRDHYNNPRYITENTLVKLSKLSSSVYIQDRASEVGSAIWLPVRSITQSRNEVMDIEVPDKNTFVANSILSYNCQIEKALYKYRARPHCANCYNPQRPSDSLLYELKPLEYDILTPREIARRKLQCPQCGERPTRILYRGTSKVFNLWCVHPDTMVYSTNGVDTINNITSRDGYADGEEIWTLGHTGPSKIIAGVNKTEQPIIKVKTQYDYEIGCTPQHMLYRLGTDDPEWTEAGNIQIDDLLGIQYNHQFFVGDTDISNIELNKSGKWMPPTQIGHELAYILGVYIAKGSFTRGQFTIYNTDGELIQRLTSNQLGLRFVHHPKIQCTILCNHRFIEFINKLGFTKCRADGKFIPACILKLPKDVQISFLQGLFDGDGHSPRHNGHIGYTSTSIRLINQVRMMLLNFGVLSGLQVDKRKISHFNRRGKQYSSSKKLPSYQLVCSTNNSARFYNDIGFGLTSKMAKSRSLSSDRVVIYGLNNKFRILYEKYGTGTHGYNKIRTIIRSDRKFCAVSTAKKLISGWDAFSDDLDYRFIKDRLREFTTDDVRTVWLPVRSVTDDNSPVCEISVDNEAHSYIANGFISHNSQISRTVILAYIKKEGRDYKNSGSYKTHLDSRHRADSGIIDRFVSEASEIFKYNETFVLIIRALGELIESDPRPHEGIVSKLVEQSGQSRAQVSNFLRMIRLRSGEFTDSPLNFQPTPEDEYD